jgi:APA family basic amino acid/polyamine antiporter
LLEVVQAGPLAIPDQAFAVIALGAVTNTSLFALVAATRLLFGLASNGDLPRQLAHVSPRTGSPTVAVAVCGLITATLAATGAVGALARTTVTVLLAVLTVVNVAAIRTRHRDGGWRPPPWVAWIGGGSTVVLLANELRTAGGGELTRLALLFGLGAAARSRQVRTQV